MEDDIRDDIVLRQTREMHESVMQWRKGDPMLCRCMIVWCSEME